VCWSKGVVAPFRHPLCLYTVLHLLPKQVGGEHSQYAWAGHVGISR
jgi:hypothetical protein